MRYTIEGFNQKYAMTLKKEVEVKGKKVVKKVDCTDLVILRWFVDFYPHMEKQIIGGREYAWLMHSKIKEDLPLLDISKRAFIERMQKLVSFEILDYKLTHKRGKESGTFSFYTFGTNYVNLVRSNDTGVERSNDTGVVRSNDTPSDVQTYNKDSSIIDTSIKDKSINDIKDIVAYLNEKAGTKFRATTENTKKHINARLEEGFTLEDFKAVIDKKCNEWLGTEFAQYLRPKTLFGAKFEDYLNAPVIETRQQKSAVAVPELPEDVKHLFGEA